VLISAKIDKAKEYKRKEMKTKKNGWQLLSFNYLL
jgi:hypothetical protein